MTTLRKAAHDGIMIAALAAGSAAAMLFAKGTADLVVYLGALAMR